VDRDVNAKKQSLIALVKKLYDDIKARLIDSFVRNVQTYFLSQSAVLELIKCVVADVNTMTESALNEMFRMDQIKDSLVEKEQALKHRLELTEKEMARFENELLPALLASVNGLSSPSTAKRSQSETQVALASDQVAASTGGAKKK